MCFKIYAIDKEDLVVLFLRVICYYSLQLIRWHPCLNTYVKLRMVPGLQSFINLVGKTDNTLENTISLIL